MTFLIRNDSRPLWKRLSYYGAMRLFYLSLFFLQIWLLLRSLSARYLLCVVTPYCHAGQITPKPLYWLHKRVTPGGQYHAAIVHLPGAAFGFVSILSRLSYQGLVHKLYQIIKRIFLLYGISSIYLGKAAKDNGGRLISTEYLPHKVRMARQQVDDVVGFQPSMQDYLNYVRDPGNGYLSTTIYPKKGMELTIKVR